MRYISLFIISGLIYGILYSSDGNQISIKKCNPKSFVILKADKKNMCTKVTAPIVQKKSIGKQATFDVTYNGFSPQVQTAFQYAVDIWSMILTSNVQIKVEANWVPLGTNILGSASASSLYRDFTNAPKSGTWYSLPLAEKLYGSGMNHPDSSDIRANFNSNFSYWYFGTDGNTPIGKYDFVSVVLHELCHGLGFQGSMDINGGQGSWGLGSGFPFVFDHQAENGTGQLLLNTVLFPNPSTTLAAQLQSNNIFFNGINSNIANGGLPSKLYAPATWEPGSSFSHLNESTFPAGNPNSLMTPLLGAAEAIHNPGDITLGMFEDMGWTLDPAAGIEDITEFSLITEYKLYQNYPNPFNPETHIKFDLPKSSNVKIDIYSLNGKLLSTLLDEYKSVGSHQVLFKPVNLASGVYLYKIQADEYTENHKMLFVK